ncbi:MAG: hypothetical protein LWW93_18145 [Hyphomicrobiales bacterium]|nr:hypothetical protein [Hyphomicrobiales bacterium]
MLFLLAIIHLATALILYNVAIATTDPRVLNRPLAAIAAAVWPLSLPVVVAVALATPPQSGPADVPEENLVRIGN